MTAAKYKLDNLTIIIDKNNLQYDGFTDDIMPLNIEARLHVFGFKVETVDGHNIEELCRAFDSEHNSRSKAIIAHTVKAKGVPRLENKTESHHTALTKDDYDSALALLEAEEHA